jgi:light-regulated signal transduction histidine kinase (bacteriophytochrome)
MRCVLKAAVSTDARGRRVITGLLEVQSPAPAAGPRSVPAAAQRRVPEPVSNGVAGPKSVASPGKAPELAQKALVVAHDWKEPLRTLAHYSELLRNRYQGRLDEDADDYLSFVHDASTRMKGELLRLFADTGDSTLSPASSGSPTTLPPPEGPSDTAAAFDRAVAYLAASISATKAEVTHGPLPPIMINEEELVQILMNLLGNAIKFHGDDPPRIHLSVARTGNEWLFSVEDNGIGVTDDDLPRLFTMFERGSGGRNVSGSGIGLAVCKSIVERNGGRIWAARNGSRGSTFFFTIPTHEIGAGAPRSAPRVTSLRPVR